MKKIVFSLLMLVPFGLVSCFSGASKSSTEEIETQKMQQQVDSLYKKMSQSLNELLSCMVSVPQR